MGSQKVGHDWATELTELKQQIKRDSGRTGEWESRYEKSIKSTAERDKGKENMKEMMRDMEESGMRDGSSRKE